MKLKDDPKIQTVSWFLDFLNDDLESMSSLEVAKRGLEAGHYFNARTLFGILDDYDSWLSRERVDQHINKQLNQESNFTPLSKQKLTIIQSSLKKFFSKLLNPELAESVEVGHVKLNISRYDVFYMDQTILDYSFNADVENILKAAKITFSHALDKVPVDAIKTCDECGKYYLHLSKKPKFYCNPKCTSRALSRKRREKDPEAYRKQQRDIMRKKYLEEKAKKLGKPIDKVKIQKRTPKTKKAKPKEG